MRAVAVLGRPAPSVPLPLSVPLVPNTAVVIVSHRDAPMALRCVAAVRREVPREAVCVVMNLPAQADADGMRRLREEAGIVVANTAPKGYGANANAGVRALPAGFGAFLVLNDDAIPAEGAIAAMVGALGARGAGMVGARLLGPDGRDQAYAFHFPTVASECAGIAILPRRIQDRLRRRLVLDQPAGVSTREVDWVLGAALAVDAAAWTDVGGFDERYFMWMEETDLAARLSRAGWTVQACRSAVVSHVGAVSTSQAARSDRVRVFAQSRARYVRTHWHRRHLAAWTLVQPLVYAWNAVYVAVRVVLNPGRRGEKLSLFRDHWDQRLTPRRLFGDHLDADPADAAF